MLSVEWDGRGMQGRDPLGPFCSAGSLQEGVPGETGPVWEVCAEGVPPGGGGGAATTGSQLLTSCHLCGVQCAEKAEGCLSLQRWGMLVWPRIGPACGMVSVPLLPHP